MTPPGRGWPLDKFNANPPASDSAIRRFEAEPGPRLPEDYMLFLRESNGGEGFLGQEYYVSLWRLEELIERNLDYGASVDMPGLFFFGSDGGGEAFAFDLRFKEMPIVAVPFIGAAEDTIWPIAPDFATFLEGKFPW